MTRPHSRLFAALLMSIGLHLVPFLDHLMVRAPHPEPAPPLHVELQPVPPPTVPLTLPDQPKPMPAKSAPRPTQPKTTDSPSPSTTWTQAIRQHLKQLDAKGQFYPADAIARGEQGEVLVLLMLDESGQVIGSRVEQSSGYRALDEAALRAVRSLRALPADAPRQSLLPVR